MVESPVRLPLWSRPSWAWLFSLRIGLVLLAILTLASIAGTLIPETKINQADGTVLAISAMERSQALVYHAWWYQLLLLLLALIIGCSTVRTIMEKILLQRRPRFMRTDQFYQAAPCRRIQPYSGDADRVADAFTRRGFKAAVDGLYGYATRGTLSRWGAPLAHLGFVIVLLGGFLSTWLAREGMVSLMEGQQTDKILLRGDPPGEEPLGATIRCEDFDTAFFPRTQIPSHFTSTISVLKNDCPLVTGPVEVNHSFIVNGWELHQTSYEKAESENRYELTLKPEGQSTTITLKLSSGQRRTIPGLEQSEIALSQTSPLTWTIFKAGQKTASGRLETSFGHGSMRLIAERFEPDFVMGENHTITSRSSELNNPALKVSLYRGLELLGSQWLFGREELKGMMHHAELPYELDLVKTTGQAPDWRFQVLVHRAGDKTVIGYFDLAPGREASFASADDHGSMATPPPAEKSLTPTHDGASGWTVRLIRKTQAYSTIITLTRNPMIPVIYFGCAVMLLGLMVAFFIRRREVWFWVDAAQRRLYVAAVYRYTQPDPDNLDRATLAAIESIKECDGASARIKVNKEQASS